MSVLSVWIAAFLTLAIFSFLYKDNPIYKLAEHLFIGISAGYFLIQQVQGVLIPNLFKPLAEAATGGSPSGFWRLGALLLSLMLLMRLSGKASWISRWPLAFVIGAFAALRMLGYAQSDLVEQINGTMVPIAGNGLPWFSWDSPSVFNHLVLIVGVISVLVYFFFSLERKGPLKHAAYLGTFFLMITFGSSFGYTVLGRVSLLIGRVQDLYQYSEPRYGYASLWCAGLIVLLLIGWEWHNRRRRNE